MKTTFKEEDNLFVMYFEGRLDTAASAQTEEDMKPLYDCSGHDIILDCTNLEYISSSGLRLFLGLLKTAKPKGKTKGQPCLHPRHQRRSAPGVCYDRLHQSVRV